MNDSIILSILIIVLLILLSWFLIVFLKNDKSKKTNPKINNINIGSNKSIGENPNIRKSLNEYFSSLERYLKSSFLRKYILSLRSISSEDTKRLEKLYPEVDVKTISFPFQSVELVKNMEQINMYILEEINPCNINGNMKDEHSYILRELKRLIALKAH